MAALKLSESKGQVLRYGENPHQKAISLAILEAMFDKLHGKELSYNNLFRRGCCREPDERIWEKPQLLPSSSITMPVASPKGRTSIKLHADALAGDPVSAFGGILIANNKIDAATAEEIHQLFWWSGHCPILFRWGSWNPERKRKPILMVWKETKLPETTVRTCLNGTFGARSGPPNRYRWKFNNRHPQ